MFLVVLLLISISSIAQRKNYTVIQAGWNVGFANEGYVGAFNGYSFNFVFGKNFNDRAYLGLGIGSENFKGKYRSNDPYSSIQQQFSYNQQLLPIFVDGRLPIGSLNQASKIGLLANAGYAPNLGIRYDQGFLFKGGFYYAYESARSLAYFLSATYGYQQLTENYFQKDFQHQHFNISLGLLL